MHCPITHAQQPLPARSTRALNAVALIAALCVAPITAAEGVDVVFDGPSELISAVESGGVDELSRAQFDFDSDGRTDTALGYSSAEESILALVYERSVGDTESRGSLRTLPQRPDFLAAGDLDADGDADIVTASISGSEMTILLGDGSGGFGVPLSIPLGGDLTAIELADINRRDGLPEIIMGVVRPEGPELLVFESPRGAIAATPERIALEEPAQRLEITRVPDRATVDLAVWGKRFLTIVEGRDRELSWSNPSRQVPPPRVTPLPFSSEALVAELFTARQPETGRENSVTGADEPPALTLVVNSTDDLSDATPGDGVCETVTGGGSCTLRAAIEEANGLPAGHTQINFSIPGTAPFLIVLGSALPDITETVTLDGSSQPGFAGTPLIRLSTNDVAFDALVLTAGSSVIRGMMLIDIGGHAIVMRSQGGNRVEGCFIGTNGAGGGDNGADGVRVEGVGGNTIGGTAAGEGNLISGNFGAGIRLMSAGATTNLVLGNRIGLRADESGGLGNGAGGVRVEDAPGNTIGGAAAGARNVISGNTSAGGVILTGSGATGNLVQGNFIGTDSTGEMAIGNADGVVIESSANSNTIGGTAASAGNLISGNGEGIASSVAGTLIQGNTIGTDVGGGEALANSGDGVEIFAASANVVGGTAAGAGNLISGNGADGVHLRMPGSTGNFVQGNLIGTDATGAAAPSGPLGSFGNLRHGVALTGGAASNLIGGAVAGAANTIAFNGEQGVWMDANFTTAATGNRVEGNEIFSHIFGDGIALTATSGLGNTLTANSIRESGDLGIDLHADGVTANDAGDGDGGANSLQNFPVLSSAVTGSSITVEGSLDSSPSTAFTVELFSSPSCDPSGHGEAGLFLGSDQVTTNGAGAGPFSITVATTPDDGSAITATATDPDGNTSELSSCVTLVSACGEPSSLELTNHLVTGFEEHIACVSIFAHSAFVVDATGTATLRAGSSIQLGDGFSVEEDGELELIIDATLGTP